MSALLQVFSVLIKKPAVAITLGVIVGLTLGLVIGWGLWPVQFTDATPEILRVDLQEDYMRMTIDSFRVNSNPDLAVQRYMALGNSAGQTFLNIEKEPGDLDPAILAIFRQVVEASLGKTIENTLSAAFSK